MSADPGGEMAALGQAFSDALKSAGEDSKAKIATFNRAFVANLAESRRKRERR